MVWGPADCQRFYEYCNITLMRMLLIPKSFRAYVFHVHALSVFVHLLYTDNVYGIWLEVVPYVLMYTVYSLQFAKPHPLPPQMNFLQIYKWHKCQFCLTVVFWWKHQSPQNFPIFFQLQIKVVPVIVIISKCKAVCSLHFLYIYK